MTRIFHITTDEEWQQASRLGTYAPESLKGRGFIHCSYAEQLLRVASSLFRGWVGLVLLEIEPSRLGCDVVCEDLDGGQEVFPHIYGPVPSTAVVAVHALPCDEDGLFSLPKGVNT